MSKEKYLVILTEGDLENEILQVVKDHGYKLNEKTGYCKKYTYKFTKDEKVKLKSV